jgi:hypothetical protein
MLVESSGTEATARFGGIIAPTFLVSQRFLNLRISLQRDPFATFPPGAATPCAPAYQARPHVESPPFDATSA